MKQFHSDPTDGDSDNDGLEDGEEDGNDDDGAGRLTFESSLGFPVTVLVMDDTKVFVDEECGVEAAGCLLQEGQDIVALRFLPEPYKGVPVVRWLVLACPYWD